MKKVSDRLLLPFAVLLVFLVLSRPKDCRSQQLFTRTFKPGYEIESKKINALCEDERGFVFLGTGGAVYLFDGTDYEALPFPDSLASTNISALLAVENSLFAGLENGLLLHWPNIRLLARPQILFRSGAKITDLVMKDSNLWVSTYSEGLYIGSEKGNFRSVDGLPDKYVYDIQADDANNIWCGTDAGLLKIMLPEDNSQAFVITAVEGLPDLIVTSLYLDEADILWLGFHDAGFCSYDLTTEKLSKYPVSDAWKGGKIKSLFRKDQYLWLSNESFGLMAFNIEKQQLISWSASENPDIPQRITAFANSRIRGFWIVGNEQFSWSAGRQIEIIEHLGGIDCRGTTALLADSRNRLWWSNGQGLFVCETHTGNYQNAVEVRGINGRNIGMASCLFEDKRGNIWMGTLAQGLYQIDAKTLKTKHYSEKDGLINANILSVTGFADSLWIATFGGVSKAVINKTNDLQFVSPQTSAPAESYIYDLAPDYHGRIWHATDGQGVWTTKGELRKNMLPDSLMHEVFYTLTQSNDSALWMASPNRGIFRLKNDSLLQIHNRTGLSSSSITSLLQTQSPWLLAVGYDGFDLINIYNRRIIPLSKQYGLPSAQTGLGVITINTDGTVFIGTNDGIVRLENLSELANRQPLISMKKMMANLEIIDYQNLPTLDYNQRQLSVYFAGLWYANPGRSRFLVDVGGHDANSFITRDQTLHFGNLQPGLYRLHISGLNNSENQLSLSFKIARPFWLQWWFAAIVFVVLFLAFYLWIKAREKRIRLQQSQLREKAAFEYRFLRSQVNPHFLFNSFSTLIALIENQKEDAVAYVEKLSDFFRQILEQHEATLTGMDQELKMLETYLFLQQKRYGQSLKFRINLSQEAMQSRVPPMTMQMLAENAIKHNIISKTMPLELEIRSEGNKIIFKNQLQPKIKAEISTGLGLKNITERYRLLGYDPPMVVEEEQHFLVILPFIP